MDIGAASARRVQNRLRKDDAIGRDHRDIEVERREFGLRVFAFQAFGSADGQALFLGPQLHRAFLQFLAALRGAGGLAIDGDDVVPRRVERGERRHRKGRSEEYTSELQSLIRISYAVYCEKKK